VRGHVFELLFMPELPEVETIRHDLSKKIIGKKIANFEIIKRTAVKAGHENIERVLKGNEVMKIERRGKLLTFELASGEYLLIHLKMTGQLIYRIHGHIIAGGHNLPHELGPLPNKHTAVVFNFADGSQLFFNDMRRFGYVKLVDAETVNKVESTYGPEPLGENFSFNVFKQILEKKTGNIKAILMDQKSIAGIGNIYADEICFCAGVKPDRKIPKLKLEEIKKIYSCIKSVLKLAIKHRGTTFRDYVDSEGKKGGFVEFLKVYDREGKKCLRCKANVIMKVRVAGRGTSFCPVCQK